MREELIRRAGTDVQTLRTAIVGELSILESLKAFVSSSGGFRRAQLHDFLSKLPRGGGARKGLDWLPRVTAENRAAYEEAQWHDGHPGFRLSERTPLGEKVDARTRPEYFPLHLGIQTEQPIEGLDLSSGFDLATSEVVAEVLEKARNRDALVLTGPLTAKDDRVLAVLPVFRQQNAFEESSRRPGQLLGFALALYKASDFVESVLSNTDRADFNYQLLDLSLPAGSPAMWTRRSRGLYFDSIQAKLWRFFYGKPPQWSSVLDVGMRRWQIQVSASPRFVAANLGLTPWAVLFSGLLFTLLMVSTLRSAKWQSDEISRVQRRLHREQLEANERLGELSEALDRESAERKRAEAGLFREKQQFQLMFNAVPLMIWHKDTKNRFITVNEAAATSMGASVSEIEGKPCSEIFPDRAYDLYRDDLEIIQSGKPKLGALEQLRFAGGDTLWVRTDKLPEFDAMGRVIGILVFAQDVTRWREAEEHVKTLQEELEQRVEERTSQLRAINEELESFAYSVSHDLRTPLRSIDGFNHVILEDFGDALGETGRDYLERSRAAAQRMDRLIDDLMKLTRIARAELRPERLDLSSLAATVVAELDKTGSERKVACKVEDVPLTRGDPDLIVEALRNLLNNAWKFTSKAESPKVQFGSFQNDEGETVYFVRDNGVGFDMIYADRLFGAFERLHAVDEFEGSGIGLATVRLIVRRHNGRVWAESAPGEGATFYFTLQAR